MVLATLVVYGLTLSPGVAFGDWGEMQVVPAVGGIAHPTGYPTYLLLARLVESIPVGSVAVRANALSAVLVSLSCGVLVSVAQRLGVRTLIAVLAGLAFGVVGIVWQSATVAEVNPLHLLLMAVLLAIAVAWQRQPSIGRLAAGGCVLGMAVGNHELTLLVAPFLAAAVLWSGRSALLRHPNWLLVAAGCVMLGLTVYLYIPLAAATRPPLPYNDPVTLDRFLALVTGQQFRDQFDFLSARGPAEFMAAVPELWRVLAATGTPALPVLGVAGLLLLVRQRRALGLACAGALISVVYFWGTYVHLDHYLLVPCLFLALGAATAAEALATALGRSRLARSSPERLVPAASGALAVLLLLANWHGADRSHDFSGQQYIDATLRALPPDAAVLSYWDASTPLWYAQLIEHARPDVLVIDDTNVVFEGWGSREKRIATLICTRPVYILRLGEDELAPTRAAYSLRQVSLVPVARGGPSMDEFRPLYRVTPRTAASCAP